MCTRAGAASGEDAEDEAAPSALFAGSRWGGFVTAGLTPWASSGPAAGSSSTTTSGTMTDGTELWSAKATAGSVVGLSCVVAGGGAGSACRGARGTASAGL